MHIKNKLCPRLVAHLLVLNFCFMLAPVYAATVVENIDLEGRLNTQTIDGERLRVELNDSGYMLINMKKLEFFTIEPDEKRIINMTSFYSKTADKKHANRIKLSFEKIGKGPRIAGFKTVRYKMKINDFVCADEYLSEEAYQSDDIKTLFRAFAFMAGKEAMIGVSGDGDPCERVEFEMSEQQYQQYGVPMKTVSRDGHTDHEIKNINPNAKTAQKIFKLPKNYEVLEFEKLHKLME